MGCWALERRPEGIENLLYLRHLHFNEGRLMPANLGRLTNLQTLKLFRVGKKKGFKIEELGSLSRLQGRLEIENLERVMDKSEAKKAKLQDKKGIEELKLRFDREKGRGNHDEDVLEGLQPPSTLRILGIAGYGGNHLPSWASEMRNLVELEISGCKMLISIPQLKGFSSLKRVVIGHCHQLSRMDDGAIGSNTPLLEELKINSCPKLEYVSVERLSSLQKLGIEFCGKLGSTGENLALPKCLRSLGLGYCYRLRCISSVNGLTSLKTVVIRECDQLKCLPTGLSSCTALESLEIWSCKNLRCIPSVNGLTSLKTVRIGYCVQLECLPTELSSCTALESLEIRYCPNLGFAPKELKVLPSLVHLVISPFPNLRSNPPGSKERESLTSLDCLKRLEIQSYSAGAEAFLSSIHYLPSLQVLYLVAASFPPLPQHLECYTSLQELSIDGFRVESSSPHCLGMGKLLSLTKLQIGDSNLISIPQGLKELPSLVELGISYCEKLRSFPDEENNFNCLTSLRRLTLGPFSPDLQEFPDLSSFPPTPNLEHLTIYGWEILTQLPHLIQHLRGGASSLERLSIEDFGSLEDLPEWLGDLSSLQRLTVMNCWNLKRLPSAEAIQRLSELHTLEINYSPKLWTSCIKVKGPEWSKISHIPNIKIEGKTIKSQD